LAGLLAPPRLYQVIAATGDDTVKYRI